MTDDNHIYKVDTIENKIDLNFSKNIICTYTINLKKFTYKKKVSGKVIKLPIKYYKSIFVYIPESRIN